MIFISLMIFIIAMAIFSDNNVRYNRISTLILIYAGALILNALYIQPIGSGIGIYSRLFQISLSSHFMSLGLFSFIFHYFFIILIKNNIFGSNINKLMEDIYKSKKDIYKFFICYFVFVFIMIFLIKYNMKTIYLDSVQVNVSINGVNANVTGDILSTAKELFGNTAVFLGSARLAYLIIGKNKALNSLNRIGITLGSGGGGLISYRVIDRTLNSYGLENNKVVLNGNLSLDSVNITTTGNYNIPEHPVLNLLFGIYRGVNFNNFNQPFNITTTGGTSIFQATNNTGVISALDNLNPNWRTEFRNYASNSYNSYINSPNETNLISFLIDNLTDHLYLSIITIYLLLMLLVIFICKLILSTDIEFKRLSKIKIFKWNFGEKLSKLLIWYISIWNKSSSFWIFFIIIVLILFNGVTLFSIDAMINILKKFIS